jgi:hypothetical protein
MGEGLGLLLLDEWIKEIGKRRGYQWGIERMRG